MADKQPKFESSLKKLEEVVKKLEAGDLPLDQSLKVFEEGVSLAQFCEKSLEEASGKVEKLMTDSEGKKKQVPL